MPWRPLFIVLAASVVLLCPNRASGQTTSSPEPPDRPQDSSSSVSADSQTTASTSAGPFQLFPSQMSVWYGHSTYPGVMIGTNTESQLELFGIRYHRLLIPIPRQRESSASGPTLTYTADVIPVATVHLSPGASPQPMFVEELPRNATVSTHGIGIYPVGLRLGFHPLRRLRPFLAGHSGMLYFFEPLPDDRGKRLNFAVGVGVGLRASLTPNTILSVGYRFHHLSNGFRGSINPGLDANMLYVGVGRGF